jgi:hypothetical protein
MPETAVCYLHALDYVSDSDHLCQISAGLDPNLKPDPSLFGDDAVGPLDERNENSGIAELCPPGG